MKLGMNVAVTADDDGADFIGTCVTSANMRGLRLVAEPKVDLTAAIKALKANKAKAALSVYRITQASSMADSARFMSEESFAEITRLYSEACFDLPVEQSLGVVLPEGLELIMRVGRTQSRFGVLREQLIARLNTLADVIRSAGHKVVLPSRFEDIIALTWHNFKCDIIDIEMMMSKRLDFDSSFQDSLARLNKPFWFGRAGMMGGYIMPAEQAKFLRKLIGMQIGADYAFLWSEPGSPRWEWSKDGKFLVDILGPTIQAMQTQRVLTGDPVVAGWKQRKREELSTSKVVKK